MRYSWAIGLMGLLSCQAVWAQGVPTAAEQMLNDMLRPAPVQAVPAPSTRPEPAVALEPAGHMPDAPAGNLLREGSDIVGRRGHLQKLPDSAYSELLFDASADGVLRPMLVLPNLQLMSMEDAATAMRKENLTFSIKGTVTEYRGRNYILLEPSSDGQDQLDQSRAKLAKPALVKGPVSADDMLKEMLSAERPSGPLLASARLETDLTSGPGAVSPKAQALPVVDEHSHPQIFDRVCRLNPSNDGLHEELTFEADGLTLHDPPMIALPNLKLMDLEKAAGDQHNTRVRVTGLLTEYRGRNYILLQKVIVMPDSDRQF